MLTDSFFAGLMQAMTDYAEECGLDSDALSDGGYEFDASLELGSDERDYSHVKRKAKFRLRVEKLLAAFLEENEDAVDAALASDFVSVPDLSDPEVKARAEKLRASAFEWLAQFKWENLKSDDFVTARNAWYHLDGLKQMCAMNDDTREAFKVAAESAGIKF